jgi:hypothetical protein
LVGWLVVEKAERLVSWLVVKWVDERDVWWVMLSVELMAASLG